MGHLPRRAACRAVARTWARSGHSGRPGCSIWPRPLADAWWACLQTARLRSSYVAPFIDEGTRDDDPHNFICTCQYLVNARIAHQALQGKVLQIPITPV